ncbi:hypothetical protein MMC13_006135 [Lambiella insularis]|nr:hypothetical protein [Lambiella insularis]
MGVSGPEHFRNTGSVTSLSQEVNLGAKKFGDKHAYGPQSSSPEWVSPSIADVLKYVKASFEDETLLDALPLEAAVSSGAWHAWAAYRRTQCVGTAPDLLKGVSASSFGKLDNNASKLSATEPTNDWNWDGVWVKRVRVNVETSISDPVLYGIDSDDPIHFLDLEEPLVHSIQKQICSQ